MRVLSGMFAAAALLGAIGCSSSSSPTVAKTETGKSIVGKWKGKIDVKSANPDDPAAKLAEGMAGMFGNFELEIKEGNRFVLSVIGIPTEGKLTMSGNKITLTPETIMGKTPEEITKMNAANGKTTPPDAGKPMTGEVSADGETITVVDTNKPDSKIVFTRNTDKPKEVGAVSVSTAEANLVGDYKGEVDESKVKPEEKGDIDMMKDSISLKLNHDNTFEMTMMMKFGGTWKLKDGSLELLMTEMMGMKDDKGGGDPALFKVDGTRLIPIPEKGKDTPPFTFVKQG